MDPTTKQQSHLVMTASGPSLADSTVRTSLLHASGKLVLPANSLYVGKALRVKAFGKISNVVTTPGTLTLDLNVQKAGPTNVVAATSQAMALNVVAKTNVTWLLEWLLWCTAIGSGTSAKFMHAGRFHSESVVGSAAPAAGGSGEFSIPATSPAEGTGFDSTADQTLDLFGTFSVNTAGTNIQCNGFFIDTLG